jgi:Zn-dependent protease/CBS domain-containing protein
MKGNISLGRLFGINIYLDWSWFIIFFLITWNLSAFIFPMLRPDWDTRLNWIVGVSASLLFFSSVLAHEIAHSLVAKARGINVKSITLFIFGGIANIESEPPDPKSEFLIAAAGPAMSFFIGFVFILLGNILAGQFFPVPITQLDPIITLFLWLGPINVILAVFNLVPGFPLDGGRILRSAIWKVTNNFRKATLFASIAGIGIALLLVSTGILMVLGIQVPIFGTGLLGGLWLVFIGWFLYNAVIHSYRQVVAREMLSDTPVENIMIPEVPAVSSRLNIAELAANHILGKNERTFAVVEESRLVGLIRIEDVDNVSIGEWEQTKVGDIMTPVEKLSFINPKDSTGEALNKLGDQNSTPVVENGNVVGILRKRDILLWLGLRSNRTGFSIK